MKLKCIKIKNVKSFKEPTEIEFNDKFNILIGPNGSGKSNLLDILTICLRKYFLKPFTVNENYDNQGFFKTINESQVFDNIKQILERFYGDESKSEITIDFILKNEDIENIREISKNIPDLKSQLLSFKNGSDFEHYLGYMENWDNIPLKENEIISFKIEDYVLSNSSETEKHQLFIQYLNYFEFLLILIREIPTIRLHTNYLYFSPYRSANIQNLQANLSNENFYQSLQTIVNATSKTNLSLINLSSIYFAEKRRGFEDEATTGGYLQKWIDDEEVSLVTKYLGRLGYGWELKLVDKYKNIYEILLTKDGKKFYINQASSGEKEIINFLLGVFAFNINNGIIIIDEPELHLHPRWQSVLLDLFLELSNVTNNQFIISTHSPSFINEKSYNHIFRIYKDENNVSRETTLKDNLTFKLRDILHIINSTNNEKIFFADVVLLVEGITDRLVFQKILSEKLEELNAIRIVEIIEIKGKSNIKNFRRFLSNLNIPNFFISDLDYVNETGPSEIKTLFKTNTRKIVGDVIKNPKSKDGDVLFENIEDAISNENFDKLKEVWEFIKSSRRKLKVDLDATQVGILNKFINEQKKENNYILVKGDIEDYFPDGFKSKDLVKVIELLQDEEFQDWKKTQGFTDLNKIIEEILIASGIK